jgi:hypothetical protein
MAELKEGEVADPFNTRVKGKDEERVPTGNPNTPVLSGQQLGDEAMRRRRRASEQIAATTRLKDY